MTQHNSKSIAIVAMTLNPKQKAAVAMAPAARKAAMKAGFERQNVINRQQQVQKAVPATRPTRKAAGVTKAKPRVVAHKRVKNFLDPMCPLPAPTMVSDGKALPHTSLVSTDFTVSSTNTTVLIVTNTGDSGTVGVLYNVDANGKYIDGLQVLTIPTLANADYEGGPSALRAMKCGVTVVNCSNALKRGGRVTYLNSSQRLPAQSNDENGAFGPIIEGIKNSPYRKRINGDELVKPMQLIGYPVDSTEYHRFNSHRGTLTSAEFGTYIYGARTTAPPQPQAMPPHLRPMSIIAYIFDPTAETQDYSVTVRASYYTRWPLTSVPGQSMRPIPTAPPHQINDVRDHTEETANDLVHVIEGGALATIGPKLMNSVGSAITRGLGSMANVVEAQAAGAVERGLEASQLEEVPLLML